MAQEIVMTAEGFEELKRELADLKTHKRQEIAEKIKVARGFGDLSENSEYDEAKNEQAIMEARIVTIEEQLKHVKIVDEAAVPKDTVSIGSYVKFLDVSFGDEMEFRIVTSLESSNQPDTITDNSPVGKALLGHKVGETVTVNAPNGSYDIKILAIRR